MSFDYWNTTDRKHIVREKREKVKKLISPQMNADERG